MYAQYERVVYLDADTLVLDSIDDLFEREIGDAPGSFAAAPDVFPPDRFNAGMIANSSIHRV
jgi:glycogenin glucosyltransferase